MERNQTCPWPGPRSLSALGSAGLRGISGLGRQWVEPSGVSMPREVRSSGVPAWGLSEAGSGERRPASWELTQLRPTLSGAKGPP